MEYELKLDDLLKSLTELGIDTDKLTIVEKSEKFDEQEFINDYRNSKVSYIQNINKTKAVTRKVWVTAFVFILLFC